MEYEDYPSCQVIDIPIEYRRKEVDQIHKDRSGNEHRYAKVKISAIDKIPECLEDEVDQIYKEMEGQP